MQFSFSHNVHVVLQTILIIIYMILLVRFSFLKLFCSMWCSDLYITLLLPFCFAAQTWYLLAEQQVHFDLSHSKSANCISSPIPDHLSTFTLKFVSSHRHHMPPWLRCRLLLSYISKQTQWKVWHDTIRCDLEASLSRVGMGVAALLRKSAMKKGGWEMSGTGRMVEEKPSYEYTAVLISPGS